tara:strand:- start:60 stop:347 length:288 start_codon:yes stop_codon:yes gene_type:complete
MDRYQCPYCSPKYQFFKKKYDGSIICGQCGDTLIKKPLINPIRFIALIAVSAFIAPLIIIIINSFTYLKPQQPKNNFESMAKIQLGVQKEADSLG